MADETINRVCLKIGDGEIQNKMAFIYGFAKNLCLESLRSEKNHLNIDDVNVSEKEREDDDEDFSHKCLEKCLNALPAENRSLILAYFSEEKQAKIDLHKRLSEGLKMTQTALRVKIMRIKQKLKTCLEECVTV